MIGTAELARPVAPIPIVSNWRVAAVAVPIGCLSLWDFYIGEVRIFDFTFLALASLVLSVTSLTRVGEPAIDRRSITPVAGIFVLIFGFSLAGIASNPDNLKPSLGMLLGVTVFMLTRCVKIEEQLINRAISAIACVHLFAFFLQLLFFLSTKQVLNYHIIVGLHPRVESAVFRAAGLFLEPAIYCFFSCSLFLLRRQRKQRFTFLDTLLLLSMFLSLSFWGIAAGILMLFVFRVRFALTLAVMGAIAGLYVFTSFDLSDSPIYLFFENRLDSLGSDPSALGRYGGTFAWTTDLLSDHAILFGNGINNFFEKHGSNGWAFIVNSLGLIGTSLLLILFASLTPPRRWVLFAFSIALLLTAAPLWKVFYFWFWVGLMLSPTSTFTESSRALAQRMT
jgi:hypothetical protein